MASMRVYIAEHVLEGHPDKVADQISDAILDELLCIDPYTRLGCDCLVTNQLIVVAGEAKTKADVDFEKITRDTLKDIGYSTTETGLDVDNCEIIIAIHSQTHELSEIVDSGMANDQSLVVGYATDETPEYMPESYELARKLARRLSQVRKDGTIPYLRPDGKTQVCLRRNDETSYVDTIVVSPHHNPGMDRVRLKEDIVKFVIKPIFPENYIAKETKIYVNETGSFHIGGPAADTGLTGRKIIVDTYGDMIPHGGGAFSGKDPSKVDRSGAYFARYLAKNCVINGFAQNVLVRLAYAKGVRQPILFEVLTGNSPCYLKINPKLSKHITQKIKDMSFQTVVELLNLRRPIYKSTACWGHFGRNDISLPWEQALSL